MSLKDRHNSATGSINGSRPASPGEIKSEVADGDADGLLSHSRTSSSQQHIPASVAAATALPATCDLPSEPGSGAAHILKRSSFEYVALLVFVLFIISKEVSIGARATETFVEKVGITKNVRPPWMFKGISLGVDQTDGQWREFSDHIPLMGPALLLFALLARGLRFSAPDLLSYYYVTTGFIFVFYLQGMPSIFMIALQLANYFGIAKLHAVLPFKLYMALMWFAHIAVLFVNDRYDGYRFAAIHPSLDFLQRIPLGFIRWHIVFNMSTLRMIAFNYDIWEARFHGAETRDKVERKHKATCVDCALISGPCYKLRTDASHPLEQYNIITYFAYLLYIPLFIGGPMSSFNAFVSHLQRPQCSFGVKDGIVYCIRIAGSFFCLAFLLHFVHLNAIRDYATVFADFSTSEKLTIMYLTLAFLWLKFNIIWKFFRLIALIDGVEAPEDMRRCFSNTVTVQSFWRDWHASFNAWIVRYMYVPMGGSRYRMVTIFPIFGFIALWHDITMNLFMWALVMCVAFVPEIAVTSYFYTPRFKALHAKWYWRYVRAIGGTVGISSLIAANLVGFGVGTKNTSHGVATIFSAESAIIALSMMMQFFAAATFGIRDRDLAAEETRRLRKVYGLTGKGDE